jgi:hypothetical protein
MDADSIPLWAVFVGTCAIVLLANEGGYRLGRVIHRRAAEEKDSPVSAIAASILGLTAFMLAFTFSIVTDRYDARKALVRDEANAIGTTYLRSDFLPAPDRSQAANLLRKYVDGRVAGAQSRDLDLMHRLIIESERIQRQLWDMAVVHARKDMNSDVAALYIDSLNEMIHLHAERKAVALQSRVPAGIWLVLGALIVLGMLGIGYQTAIAGSRRSRAAPILAVSFAVVIMLIASLDRPVNAFVPVSQRPLVDLRASMAAGAESRLNPGENGSNSAGQSVQP